MFLVEKGHHVLFPKGYQLAQCWSTVNPAAAMGCVDIDGC